MKFFNTPDDLDGYGIEVEPSDLTKTLDLPELKSSAWTDILWEGVIKRPDRYIAYYLTSNTFLLTFVIPDREWLDADLRESLEKHRTDLGVPYSEAQKREDKP